MVKEKSQFGVQVVLSEYTSQFVYYCVQLMRGRGGHNKS
jgi:hypothetical protein